MLIEIANESRLSEELAVWRTMPGEALSFCLGQRKVAANLVTCRPEDRAIGTAHWVQFRLDQGLQKALGDFRTPGYFELGHESYQHQSVLLTEDIRQSLLDDLKGAA
jgi:hypothetical protein